MATKSLQALLSDIRLLGGEQYSIVEAVRTLVKASFPDMVEEVKYGGILFSSGVQFCGVFAYKEHVSVELSMGAKIADTYGFLEGRGKGRRHLKLFTVVDVEEKRLAHYLPLALEAAEENA
ncbi:hypothetical protein GCM10011365_13630 [Marinicella pacifica]|uniref:YdhG-like domain-containing protein n=1 Tax=Marinicella pacifica TaxID=1171543 RepID=A0A917CQA9_9GAMM|nr:MULTISPECIES: DUF1801 domain-containing protein [Gammaproteobacteria]GGF93631.1 hypothetical protein GCM10011365_13630 [Marinicella pacifica]